MEKNDERVVEGLHRNLSLSIHPNSKIIMKHISTVWRVTKEQKKWVEKQAKKLKISEAEVIRQLINEKLA